MSENNLLLEAQAVLACLPRNENHACHVHGWNLKEAFAYLGIKHTGIVKSTNDGLTRGTMKLLNMHKGLIGVELRARIEWKDIYTSLGTKYTKGKGPDDFRTPDHLFHVITKLPDSGTT